MSSIDRVLAALDPYDPKAEAGGWVCHCPGPGHQHGDKHRSLKVDYRDGKTLIKCHTGCSTGEVLSAIKLKVSDLFDDEPTSQNGAAPRLIATYDYTDEQGTLLYQALRYEPKSFKQRKPGAGGTWDWKLNGVRQVPYHLHDLAATPEKLVFITEGEKDADRIRQLGFLATTNSGGAGNWRQEFGRFLKGRHVVILPDNDTAGFAHVEDVIDSVNEQAVSTRVLLLPGLKSKGDVSDWLDAGGTEAELRSLVMAAPLAKDWQAPKAPQEPVEAPQPLTDGFIFLDDLLAEPDVENEWVVYELLEAGGMSFLSARPGSGKSTLIRTLCAAVAAGLPFLGRPTTKGTVLLLSHEEQRKNLKRHFKAMGCGPGLQLLIYCGSAPEQTIAWLRQMIEKYSPSLIVIDTLSACFGITNINDNSEMTRHLQPVLAQARESGTHICIIHWTGKEENGPMGGTAILGTLDVSMTITFDEAGNRYIHTDKVREGTPLPQTALALDPRTGMVHLAGEYNWVQMERCAEKFLEALGKEKLTRGELYDKVKMRDDVRGKTINAMIERNFLISEPERGKEYFRAYRGPIQRPIFGAKGATGV